MDPRRLDTRKNGVDGVCWAFQGRRVEVCAACLDLMDDEPISRGGEHRGEEVVHHLRTEVLCLLWLVRLQWRARTARLQDQEPRRRREEVWTCHQGAVCRGRCANQSVRATTRIYTRCHWRSGAWPVWVGLDEGSAAGGNKCRDHWPRPAPLGNLPGRPGTFVVIGIVWDVWTARRRWGMDCLLMNDLLQPEAGKGQPSTKRPCRSSP